MPATMSTDFVFEPKVWQDHIRGYFDKLLVFGAIAVRDDTLAPDAGKGMTVTFPFFKTIGPAEEPAEDEGLTVDKLADDSFQATVREVGKAVGIKKKAFKKSAATTATIIDEIQRQIARVHAEKVDADLVTEMNTPGNYTDGYTATAAGNTMTWKLLNTAKILGFGDKADTAAVCFMHSLQYLDMMNDPAISALVFRQDDPLGAIDGFKGRLLNMGIVTVDTVPEGPAVDGKRTFAATIHKPAPYGIIVKQEMELESDYDILQREWVFTGNEWYGVKSFHGKHDPRDKRTVRILTTVANS